MTTTGHTRIGMNAGSPRSSKHYTSVDLDEKKKAQADVLALARGDQP